MMMQQFQSAHTWFHPSPNQPYSIVLTHLDVAIDPSFHSAESTQKKKKLQH